MSVVTWVKNNSRAIGKIGLYGAGGVLVGWPAIKAAILLWRGQTADATLEQSVRTGTGYVLSTGQYDTTAGRNAVIRTIIGAGAIYAARKL